MYSSVSEEKIIAITQTALEEGALDQGKVHTLKQFSIDHFHPPPKETLPHTVTLAKGGLKKKGDEMWNFSRVRHDVATVGVYCTA